MHEILTERAEELRRTRVPFVRATVVRAQRPTSAHAGDVALLHPDGGMEGFVGGTCAEASVREYGLRALGANEPLLLRILPDASLPTSEEGSVTVGNPCLSGGAVEIFLEPYVPPRRVVVVGDTPIAQALEAFGTPLGWTIELTDGDSAAALFAEPAHSSAGAPADPFSAFSEALIVASHGRGEETALTAALRAGVPYVAMVASRKRAAAVLASLDVDEEQRARVHSPAGLDIGGRTAPEIALAILAEFIQERHHQHSAEQTAASGSAGQPGVVMATSATDPVCGMTVAAVPATAHLEQGGTVVYFCGEGCRTTFGSAPEDYAAAR